MSKYPIKTIFKLNQGHQITDEEIYYSESTFPVYTGENELKGYYDKTIVSKEDLPCLSYPTKGSSVSVFIQDELFDANNTAVLIPKDEWRDKINLYWFKYKLPFKFLEIMTSKTGRGYLNKEKVKNLKVKLPSKDEQDLQVDSYKKLALLKEKLSKINTDVEDTMSKNIALNYSEKLKKISMNEIFSYISRNDELSRRGVYNRAPLLYSPEKTITVLHGSTEDNIIYGEIEFDSPGINYIEDRQILHVVTRGKAGELSYMPKGTYATNTNAYIIHLKKEKYEDLNISNKREEEIFLKFMMLYLQPIFYENRSQADRSIFPISKVVKNLEIPFFKYNKQMKNIILNYEKLEKIYQTTNEYLKKINQLLNKEVVTDDKK